MSTMDGTELRALQAPLKERYRADPAAAMITLSASGTLGVDREAPVGFSEIRLAFELDTDADAEQLATLQRLTERYCVVYQTLSSGPSLSTSFSAAPGR